MKYKIAVYLRVSKEEYNNEKEPNSITNQRQIIDNYLKEHKEYKLADYYIDDGYSGTSFDRPEFQRMLEDIKNNKINVIIIKDLSRLGRNYIETGNFVEVVFPTMGVTVISVDENKIEVHGVIIGEYDGDLADNEVIKIFKNNSNIKIISYFETAMIFLIIDIVIMIIILNYVEKLFNNIKNNQTTFTLENVGFIKKISYLMIALIFITPISDTLFSIISSVSNGGENPFEIMNILEILIIFSMSYIFEYGYEIQKDSKGKIYSEKN